MSSSEVYKAFRAQPLPTHQFCERCTLDRKAPVWTAPNGKLWCGPCCRSMFMQLMNREALERTYRITEPVRAERVVLDARA